MSILNYAAKYILFFLYGLVILGLLSSCSGGKFWDPADARKVPPNVNERVRKNLEEVKVFHLIKQGREDWVEQVINSPVLIQCGEQH